MTDATATPATPGPCPSCGGAWLGPDHPTGPLTYRHAVGCPIDAADMPRRVGDLDVVRHGGSWDRPATATERALLADQGHRIPPDLFTRTALVSGGIRRTWPQLERTTP